MIWQAVNIRSGRLTAHPEVGPATSSPTFHFWIADDPGGIRLDGLPLGGLTTKQKRFWQRSVAADLERAEVLVPIGLRYFRVRVNPEPKMMEVSDADRPVTHPVYQVPADAGRQMAPRLDSWQQLPKTIRPI